MSHQNTTTNSTTDSATAAAADAAAAASATANPAAANATNTTTTATADVRNNRKTVRFNDQTSPLTYYVDNDNEARNGQCWTILAIDRLRFQRRIRTCELLLNKCVEIKLQHIKACENKKNI